MTVWMSALAFALFTAQVPPAPASDEGAALPLPIDAVSEMPAPEPEIVPEVALVPEPIAPTASTSTSTQTSAPISASTSTPASDSVSTSAFDFGALRVGGFARVGFSFVRDDPTVDFIGQSPGFEFAAARLELSARPFDKASVHLSIDAAARQAGASGSEEYRLAARDVFIEYAAFPALVARAGQFKAPFLAETLGCDADSLFLRNSIVERGLAPPVGYAANGLGLGRQLGVSISSERLDVFGGIGVRYEVGVFNGTGENALANDSGGGSLMPVARVELDYQRVARLGAAVAYGKRAQGTRPDQLDEENLSWTVDVSVSHHGVQLLAAYAQNHRSFASLTPVVPDEVSRGALAQISWRHPGTGLEPAYRFELLEPSDLVDDTRVMHHAIGLNWKPAWLPVRIYAAYTLRIEAEARGLTNDGVELGAQLGFF
ncbi:MAG: OprO/OprP family phosphate-selective porin [Myxococcales bacterium]|jgi:hypothetical protein|nr:OprO/OprP family phosphate-selective porin [Myxococcales bacterium]